MIQARRSGSIPLYEPMLPLWVSWVYWVDWALFLVLIFLNWKFAILVFVIRFISKVLPILEAIGNILMSPFKEKVKDNLDKRKIMANLLVLGHGSYKVAKSYSRIDEEQKNLLKFATKSIKKIDPIGGVPLGFPTEFVATYPDVVLWWKNLSNEEQGGLMSGIEESNILDSNRKVKQKYLKILIDTYQNTRATLECSLDSSR